MIVLDTCAMIFDALAPDKLSSKALRAVENGEKHGILVCSDISLWEISMLIKKRRLDPGIDTISFIKLALSARKIKVMPITPEIADISSSHKAFVHHDPADRLIAATTLHVKGALITCDNLLRNIKELQTIW
jgi:PIN domain nuclease of toxin-antitoxin system